MKNYSHKPSAINYLQLTISIYHALFPSQVRVCRFEPTCSQYFLDATEKYGFLKGISLTTRRILSCHPLSKRPIFDPA